MTRLSPLALLLALAAVAGDDDPAAESTDLATDGGAPTDAGADACPDCPTACPAAAELPEGFVCVPAGEFWMGSPEDEFPRDGDEERHLVRLTRPTLVAMHEVTQTEWQTVVELNPAYFQEGGPGGCAGEPCEYRPVERVSWYEALTWLNLRSEAEGLDACYTLTDCRGTIGEGCDDMASCLDGYRCDSVEWVEGCRGYRLPTEAEWEYAARAGVEDKTYDMIGDIAWYSANSSTRTHTVGRKDANAWGLHDVYGNVYEWTWDIYAMNYGFFGRPEVAIEDPRGEDFGDTRVIRGGSWFNGYEFARAAARDNAFSATRDAKVGFRMARSLP